MHRLLQLLVTVAMLSMPNVDARNSPDCPGGCIIGKWGSQQCRGCPSSWQHTTCRAACEAESASCQRVVHHVAICPVCV